MMKAQFARAVYPDLDLGQDDLAWIGHRGKGASSAHGGSSSKAVCRRTNREAIPEDGHAANSGRPRRHRLKLAKSKTAPALAMTGSLLSPGPDPCRLSVLAKKPECPRCPPPSYLAVAPRARGWTRGPQGVRGPDHWRRPPESLLGGSFKVRQEKRRKRKSGFVIRKAHNSIDLGKKN